MQPQVPTPSPATRGLQQCNPCVSHSKVVKPTYVAVKVGEVRTNPFVDAKDMVATN